MIPIHVTDLSFAFNARPALQGVKLLVEEREIFGILGPNGSGKTTLFKILATLLRPEPGHAFICGIDVAVDADSTRKQLGVVFQSYALDAKLTVRENLLHHGHLYGMCGKELSLRIDAILERFRILDRARETVENLSGGLRRRVELAKGLLHHPRVLLMDEPSSGLDPGARLQLWDMLSDVRGETGTTILLTTHLLDEAERCDRLAVLDHGFVVALGSPAHLKARIGGDIISVRGEQPDELRRRIEEKFKLHAVTVDGEIRIEHPEGTLFVPRLAEAFPGAIHSITVGRPTLEDVFVQVTGHGFWQEETKG